MEPGLTLKHPPSIRTRGTVSTLPPSVVPSHPAEQKPTLLNQLQSALRARHYSRRTEDLYAMWVRRYCRFHGLRHPAELSEDHVNAFLSHLAIEEQVSASTQNQALCALLFLYRHVLGKPIGDLKEVVRARKPARLPVVLTRDEVKRMLAVLDGSTKLMACIM